MSDNKNVPDIRFEEFSTEWRKCELREVLDIENGFAFKSEYFQTESANLIVLTPGNVHIGGGFQKGKGRFYNQVGGVPMKFVLHPEDIFITMTDLTPSAEALGYPAVVPNDGNIYLLNQRLGKLSRFDGNKFFLLHLLSTEKSHKQIVLTASGTTVKHSSSQKVLSCINYFPNDIEQQKIGNYFQNLDKLITQHQNKHNQLVNLKRAMLEKMFPKEESNVPEVRFEGFSDVWNVKKLEEIAPDISDGNWIEAEHISGSGKYRIIQTGNLGLGEYLDKTNNAKYFEQANFNTVRGNEVFQGDILISRLAEPAGRTIILPDIGSKMVTVVDVTIVRPSNSFDSTFLMTLLNSEIVLNAVNSNVSGTSHKRISRRNLEKTKLTVPSIEEQLRIGAYFKNLDKLISLQKQQLEKLKNLKKACLDKMFV